MMSLRGRATLRIASSTPSMMFLVPDLSSRSRHLPPAYRTRLGAVIEGGARRLRYRKQVGTSASGRAIGGIPFSRGALCLILERSLVRIHLPPPAKQLRTRLPYPFPPGTNLLDRVPARWCEPDPQSGVWRRARPHR